MSEFHYERIGIFLAVLRKYMQLKGALSQKDLAEMTDTGVSTMSRFLNQKTRECDPHLIAKIVAKLDIPLHEIIDFVDEAYTYRFKKLVGLYKEDVSLDPALAAARAGGENVAVTPVVASGGNDLLQKIEQLTPRQKAYLMDYLNLDMEGRDLMVDLGTPLFHYFKQKGMQF